MSAGFWRLVAGLLFVVCVYQGYRACTRAPDAPPAPAADQLAGNPCSLGTLSRNLDPDRDDATGSGKRGHGAAGGANDGAGFHAYGFELKVPLWAMALAPQPGEDMLAYRDRVVPLAQQAIQPQRDRVKAWRDQLAQTAHLSDKQLAQLDQTTQQTADALEAKVMSAVMNGDFTSDGFRPMTGVAFARDMLDEVLQSDQQFRASLTDDQRAALAKQPFDFADYLLFSTPWEQALGYGP